MEESQQRKERLKAMRLAASQDSVTNNDGNEHSVMSLSNPLLEPEANPSGQVQPLGQSFNYYTNPMAAFSGNKQKSQVSPQISQNYASNPPTRPFQAPINQSPNQNMYQPHGQYPNPNYGYASNPPPPGANFPGPRGYPGPHFTNSGPGSGHFQRPGGYPSPQPQFNQGSGQSGYPSPRPHFGPGPGQGPGRGYPGPGPHMRPSSNHGRGQWLGNNMNSSPSGSSSGRGRWSGQGGGRGQGRGRGGAHDHVSAEDRPDLFYNKSMVEDPWKFLEPVIWKSQKPKWLSESFGTKKARVSESPRFQQQSGSSKPSLAEILAASFNEAANDETNT